MIENRAQGVAAQCYQENGVERIGFNGSSGCAVLGSAKACANEITPNLLL